MSAFALTATTSELHGISPAVLVFTVIDIYGRKSWHGSEERCEDMGLELELVSRRKDSGYSR